ncbi:DUF551 domain-containing protein [Klebsiella quasipneumoniae]|uniref:DUF551 domain-containing protein n=1 Tax=Klebsiella quasipneumoniae TaxID=1463165 RepID=UPI003D9A7697
MSEFSRETLLNIIETDHVQCGEASAFARMALAAMDSEPVIVVGDDGGDALSYRRLIQSFAPGTKLYLHAEPAPASEPVTYTNLAKLNFYSLGASLSIGLLPDGENADEVVRHEDDPCRASMLQAGSSPVIPDGSASMLRRWLAFGRGMQNAGCQLPHNLIAESEAMLAASQHDTPALNSVQSVDSVADRWIPVSERMPENDGAYLCWDNRYVTTYAFIFGAWQANQFIAKNITHWMPLPAGPQEVR